MNETEKLNKLIEPILIKVYNMAMGATERDGYDETVVRGATLVWAKEEVPKACKKYLVFRDGSEIELG